MERPVDGREVAMQSWGKKYQSGIALVFVFVAGCATVQNHYQQAQLLQTEGKTDEAIAAYYQAVAAEPNRPEVHIGLAELLSAKKLKDDALRILIAGHERLPQDSEITRRLAGLYFERGKNYQQLGKISDAYEAWQKTLQLVPEHKEAKVELVKLYSDRGEEEKAAVSLQQLVQTTPQNPDNHRSLGLVYFKQGKFAEAIREFQQALQLNPRDAQAYTNLGSVYLKTGQLEDAGVAFEQAVNFEPPLAAAHINWGTVFYKQGRYLRARQEWETAQKLEPGNETVRQNLSMLDSLGY